MEQSQYVSFRNQKSRDTIVLEYESQISPFRLMIVEVSRAVNKVALSHLSIESMLLIYSFFRTKSTHALRHILILRLAIPVKGQFDMSHWHITPTHF